MTPGRRVLAASRGIDRYTPGFIGDVVNDRQRLYYVGLGVALAVYALIRYLVRTPFGIALEGIRDEPDRAWPRSATTSRSTAPWPSASAR